MEKLELKHLAPYLPFKLEAKGKISGDIFEISLLCNEGVGIVGHSLSYGLYAGLDDIYPILRPLSQLTQEIEHNGERFVPALELVKEKEKHGKWKDHAPTIDYTYGIIKMPFGEVLKVSKLDTWVIMLSFQDPARSEYFIIQKLFEWHFDVFGLIEKGLAIEKK